MLSVTHLGHASRLAETQEVLCSREQEVMVSRTQDSRAETVPDKR